MTAKQIEELFELTSSHGLTLVSKAAPHGRWRINVLVPDGARLQSSKDGGTCDKELCSVDAETPLQAVQVAYASTKMRISEGVLTKEVAV